MYKGKYTQKRRRRPALWAALALALVLTLSVGGTVAYLFDNTDSVTNTFTPAEAKVEIEEKFDGTSKSEIKVKNTGDIPVYVRVMLVANYQNNDGVCGIHTAKLTSPILPDDNYNNTNWVKGSDGYYYYKTALPASKTTESLLGTGKQIELSQETECGCKMHVDVLAQAIQAQPADAVKDAWNVKLDSNGYITNSGSSNN